MGEVFNVAEKCWRKDVAVPKPVRKAIESTDSSVVSGRRCACSMRRGANHAPKLVPMAF